MDTHPTPLGPTDYAATFRARGVAAPFTTAMLAGTRVREADRKGIEVIVPNPSGARGVYILRPANVRSFCQPTLHDTLLMQRLSKLKVITPPVMRHIALQLAADGHAGRSAIGTAEYLLTEDELQCAQTYKQMITTIIAEVAPGQPPAATPADLSRRINQALRSISGFMRCPPDRLARGLQIVSEAYAPIGFGAAGNQARLPRVLQRMRDTEAVLSDWIDGNPANDVAGLGSAVSPALRTACEIGSAMLAMARRSLTDPLQLLKRWVTDPGLVLDAPARAEWLLDGWDQACLVWLIAEDDISRRAALLALPPIVPVLPRECLSWKDIRIPPSATEPPCRVISRQDGWRNGAAMLGLIERNERLRARSQ